ILGADLALDQRLGLEPLDDAADRGPVEADGVGEAKLVEARMGADREERRILHRRDLESGGFLEEHRDGDLLEPADEVAGLAVEDLAEVGPCHPSHPASSLALS